MSEDHALVPEDDLLAAFPAELVEAARDFLRNSRSASTRRAYAGDWRRFVAWCEAKGVTALPARGDVVVMYATFLATSGKLDREGRPTGEPCKPATVARALAAISTAHRLAHHASPRRAVIVQEAIQGINRKLGQAPSQRREIRLPELRAMLEALDKGSQGLRRLRDRALLLLGWAAALRRSELVALDREDLRLEPEGLVVKVRRSKTDQEGKGSDLGIPNGVTVAAVFEWLKESACFSGPVFRRVSSKGKLGEKRLTSGMVARIVKVALRRAGLPWAEYAGHSLRSGFATEAAEQRKPLQAIMDHTRHRSVKVALGYMRRGKLFDDASAAKGIVL